MNLLEILKRNPASRKIFGEREIAIIEKQAMGVSLTQSERNRLSRDIRPKMQIIIELARHQEDFTLKQGFAAIRLIDDTVGMILASKWARKIKKIVLFGSKAQKTSNLTSDIDVAVYFDDISNTDSSKFRKEMMGLVNEKVDIQVHNVLPVSLKKEIDQSSKILYERKIGPKN